MATHIHPDFLAETITRIRNFFDELLSDETDEVLVVDRDPFIFLDDDWSRTVNFVRQVGQTTQSMCQHYDDNIDLERRTWNIYIPTEDMHDEIRLCHYISTLKTPAWLREEVHHSSLNRKEIGHKITLVQLYEVFPKGTNGNTRHNRIPEKINDIDYFYRADGENNHSCLFLFNFRKGTQEFFDPLGEHNEKVPYTKAFTQRAPFLPELCPNLIGLEHSTFPQGQSLQSRLQRSLFLGFCQDGYTYPYKSLDFNDICTACLYMVILVSLRFGIMNLHLCAYLINKGWRLLNTKRMFTLKFINWCNNNLKDDGYQGNVSLDDLEHIFGLRIRIPGESCCYIRKNGKICHDAPCQNDIYCKRHRIKWKNPFGGLSCNSKIKSQPQLQLRN